jgi:uncharacterized protein YegP (UPF0339 family)
MEAQRDVLEKQKAEYTEKARGLKAFIRELTETAAKCGTESAVIETDLTKAKCDAEYYESELGRIGGVLEEEAGRTTFWVYEDASGESRWHLSAANNRIIATSGEGYKNRQDCLHAIALVKAAKEAPVKEKE